MSIDVMRHQAIFNPETFKHQIHVIGCGSVGSKLALELAKLGIKDINLWDFDIVEVHNLANQGFEISDLGNFKATAVRDHIARTVGDGPKITTYLERVTGEQPLEGVVFLATDTMKSRTEIWQQAIRMKLSTALMIEGRMGAEILKCYTINPISPKEIRFWESTLSTDDVIPVSECGTTLSIGATSTILAGLMTWQLIRWHAIKNPQTINATNKEVTNEDVLEQEIIMSTRATGLATRLAQGHS